MNGLCLTVLHQQRRRYICFFALIAILTLLSALDPPGSAAAPPAGYSQVWSDEFNGRVGSYPNPSNWTYETGYGWGNGTELETYSTTNATIMADSNATDGSVLDIKATQSGTTYYSSLIKSAGLQSWTYGYFECRAKVPPGGPVYQGFWPAFWLIGDDASTVGWPKCGELDVMEHLCGTDPNGNHQTLHGPNGSSGGYQYGVDFKESGDLGDAYHLYGMLWTPSMIAFTTDGAVSQTIYKSSLSSSQQWVFNQPFYIILNMAIGGPGSWPGNITSNTVFPADFLVDYVRVYQQRQNGLVSGKTYKIVNANSGEVVDVKSGSKSAGAAIDQWPWSGGLNQQWTATLLSNGNWEFVNVNNGYALDDYIWGSGNGALVDTWPWTNAANQQWRVSAFGDGSNKVVNVFNGLNLEVPGATMTGGTALDQQTDNGGPHQHWIFVPLN